jgi:glutaredoxin
MYGRFFSPKPKTESSAPHGKETLLLYSTTSCPFCIRVFGHIEQLGLSIERADTARDSGAREALHEKTGRSTVPCLFIDGEPLFESRDIMSWLTAYAALQGQN